MAMPKSLEDAIEIFEEIGITEDDIFVRMDKEKLKKGYWKLSKKFHPDLVVNRIKNEIAKEYGITDFSKVDDLIKENLSLQKRIEQEIKDVEEKFKEIREAKNIIERFWKTGEAPGRSKEEDLRAKEERKRREEEKIREQIEKWREIYGEGETVKEEGIELWKEQQKREEEKIKEELKKLERKIDETKEKTEELAKLEKKTKEKKIVEVPIGVEEEIAEEIPVSVKKKRKIKLPHIKFPKWRPEKPEIRISKPKIKGPGISKESIILILQIIFFIVGLILIFTGNWIIGLPLVIAGIIIFLGIGSEREAFKELLNWFIHNPTGQKVGGILGVAGGSALLFFTFGLLAALIPIGAAVLYVVLRKYHKQGAGFFTELMVSIVGLILFVGGVQYAKAYLFIEFDIRQLIGFGCLNTITLFILWFMSGKKEKTPSTIINVNVTGESRTNSSGGGEVTSSSQGTTASSIGGEVVSSTGQINSTQTERREKEEQEILKERERLNELEARKKQEEIELAREERLALRAHEEVEREAIERNAERLAFPPHKGESQPILPPHKKRFREVVQCDKCGNIQDSNTGKLGDNYYVCSKCGKKFNAQSYLKKE